jgi:hypothetical protein
MREKGKLRSDGGDSGSKKCKRGCGGSLEPDGQFCIDAFDRNVVSVTMNFLRLI